MKECDCLTCEGTCWIQEPNWCGDAQHCDPVYPCPDCNPDGDY